VPDRESNRSEKKTGLSQKFSLFMRIFHDTYRYAAGVKIQYSPGVFLRRIVCYLTKIM